MTRESFWNSLYGNVAQIPEAQQEKMAAFLLRPLLKPILGAVATLPFFGGGEKRDDSNVDLNDEIIKNPKYNPYISTINDKFIQSSPYIYKKSGKPAHIFEVARRELRSQQAGADDPEYQAYKKWRAQQGANYTPPWAQQQQQQTPQQQPVQAPVQQPVTASQQRTAQAPVQQPAYAPPGSYIQAKYPQVNSPMYPAQGMRQQQPSYTPFDLDVWKQKDIQVNRPMQPVQRTQQQQPSYTSFDPDVWKQKDTQVNRPMQPARQNNTVGTESAFARLSRSIPVNRSFMDYVRSGALNK